MFDLTLKDEYNFSKDELVEILQSDGKKLFEVANEVRRRKVGDEIYLRGLIEFSNICKNNCQYCGLQAVNRHVERYRLSEDEIIKFAKDGVNAGFKTIVLQSGEDSYFNTDRMCRIIEAIKKNDVALTLSIGERSYNDYKAFKDAGADRYLIRIETTDRDLYAKMHPNMSYDNRIECLYNLKELGYETGTGCLVGLPNQSVESLADDILFFKKLDVDMVGIGPFIPHPDTPLAGKLNPDNFSMALKVMALTRLMLGDINIPATTAMETIDPNGRITALVSGANVIMPNITQGNYKAKYEIYPNKSGADKEALVYLDSLIAKITSIQRFVSNSKGFRTRQH